MTGVASVSAFSGPVRLLDPEQGVPLDWDTPHSIAGPGSGRWPVVEGIPWLRVGRDRLRSATLDALDAGDTRDALVGLLADQDDYARTPPPGRSTLGRLVESVDSGRASLRDAMTALDYGPVADYFAHRWSTPTYLSGLGLLERHWLDGVSVVEIACGIGAFLRDLSLRGVPALGLDVVFSKLWLARRFVVPPAVALVCGDASGGWPLAPSTSPVLAFCHDAFYFLPEKSGLISRLRRLVGEAGRILIGHAHNSRFDHRGVSGEPKTPEEYASLLPGSLLYDDAELAREVWAEVPAVARSAAELAGIEAIAIAWDARGDLVSHSTQGLGLGLTRPVPGARVRLNPLLEDGPGGLRPRWPSPRFEAEYAADSPYLFEGPADLRSDIDRLVRRRILLDLPERW